MRTVSMKVQPEATVVKNAFAVRLRAQRPGEKYENVFHFKKKTAQLHKL